MNLKLYDCLSVVIIKIKEISGYQMNLSKLFRLVIICKCNKTYIEDFVCHNKGHMLVSNKYYVNKVKFNLYFLIFVCER